MLKRSISALMTCVCAFSVDVTTYHNDPGRTGQNLSETALTTANVVSSKFGKLFTISVDGKVDAEPLYLSAVIFPGSVVHNALYVVTENGSAYAFDADTGAQLWKVTTLKTGETASDNRGCSQVSPQIGLTATPVISRTTGTNGIIYMVGMSKDSSGGYHHRIHALDLTTGAEQFSGPTEIAATYPGTGDNTNGTNVVFDPKQYEDRAALLLSNGVVYTSFSSHCDDRPYTGWVIGYSATTLLQTSILDFTPNGSEGSVWMAGDGPQADINGNIYFLAANGTFDTTLTAGFPSKGDYGNAFIKLSATNNVLAVADYFEMYNGVTESNNDQDLGSGGSLLLPDMTDSNNATRHLAVGAGKDEHIYLVDRDNMGKFNSSTNSIYQDVPSALKGGAWSMPAYFNGHLYYGGVSGPLQSYSFASAKLVTPAAHSTSHTFAFPGATPSISANVNTEGIVWAVENSSPAILHAYDATNLVELYNSNQAASARDQFGSGNKFITPMIANGKVYVGTPNSVAVFGILPELPPSITSALKESGTMGRSFTYQITASHSPTSYSATGLPSGLTVSTSTGKISGTPKTYGTFNVTIGATNAYGTGTAKLVLTIAR